MENRFFSSRPVHLHLLHINQKKYFEITIRHLIYFSTHPIHYKDKEIFPQWNIKKDTAICAVSNKEFIYDTSLARYMFKSNFVCDHCDELTICRLTF